MFDPIDRQVPQTADAPVNNGDSSRFNRGRKRRAVSKRVESQWQKLDIIPALLVLVVGTVVAVALTPAEVWPKKALFWPALVMAISLGLAPVLSSLTQPKRLFEAHHLLVLAPIYWLLLDSLQMVYDLEGISRRDAMLAFVAIALFVGGVWLGVLGRPWRMPRMVREAATLDVTPTALFAIAIVAFLLGMGKFAIPCGFDLGVMWQSLLAERFSAAWTRG